MSIVQISMGFDSVWLELQYHIMKQKFLTCNFSLEAMISDDELQVSWPSVIKMTNIFFFSLASNVSFVENINRKSSLKLGSCGSSHFIK